MLRSRLQRLIQPQAMLTIAALLVGCNLGMAWALTNYHDKLARSFEISREEWGKFTTDVWNLSSTISGTVILFYGLATVASPEARINDKKALRDLARNKLSTAVMTESEIVIWHEVLKEADRDV